MIKDELDSKILLFLKNNSRASYAQIGRQIGLSASAVGERIQRLENTGVIKEYATLIDTKKIGFSVSAYILMSLESKNFHNFISIIDRFEEVEHCSRVTGENCLIMKIIVRDSEHLQEVIDKLAEHGNPSTQVILSDIITNGKKIINGQ
ncbi:Lrp/AsnC family transcriptional regulator [Aquimarina sp. BL5]|uniref:Lrp/AsnC family transcriptional regulator n=1 Tax=Aquimarina sp. BL5 TaxID=1714860 RepID=UPI000E4B13C8|nr:Lrp/AsnC family transcriptional regulator [Aquimarina sp. BL5]AXT52426.1 Lrp/AsnC family transcriptional regulator [Aquimarina sp. BL5]RKN05906.1 AsnC family transcriptional regulator [Aquimarina sp. BL5]